MSRADSRRRTASAPPHASAGAGPSGRRGERGAALVRERVQGIARSRVPVVTWLVLVAAGLAALVGASVPVGPDWLGGAGAVVVAAAYSWALAARTGGRPVVFGTLAAVVGVVVLVADEDYLRTGAAVMTCVVAAVLAVMATVPAVTYVRAVGECLAAMALAGVGALATVGFEPAIRIERFEYVTLGLALLGAFGVVYRLGAGFHGLGRRGVVTVLVGGVLLAAILGYAELLRAYGPAGLVASALDAVAWGRETLGAFPRPIVAALGVPALAYGCHMRARRRQGWWVCAFGAAGTSAVANALVNPAVTLTEGGLSVLYGLLVGLVLGYVVVRVDLVVTARRSRRRSGGADEAPVSPRPEPRRVEPLL